MNLIEIAKTRVMSGGSGGSGGGKLVEITAHTNGVYSAEKGYFNIGDTIQFKNTLTIADLGIGDSVGQIRLWEGTHSDGVFEYSDVVTNGVDFALVFDRQEGMHGYASSVEFASQLGYPIPSTGWFYLNTVTYQITVAEPPQIEVTDVFYKHYLAHISLFDLVPVDGFSKVTVESKGEAHLFGDVCCIETADYKDVVFFGNGAMADRITHPYGGGERLTQRAYIMNGVTTVGQDAFNNFKNLIFVSIPETVTWIKNGAFQSSGLKYLYCYAETPPTLGSSLPSDTKIYVPADKVDTYKSKSGWSKYSDNIFPM